MENSFITELRKVLEAGLGSGDVSLRTVARKTAMSRRAVQRELMNQGTTFRVVLDAARYRAAADLLKQEAADPGKVAARLGFSHQSSFYRAFKRWTGKTPLEFMKS